MTFQDETFYNFITKNHGVNYELSIIAGAKTETISEIKLADLSPLITFLFIKKFYDIT